MLLLTNLSRRFMVVIVGAAVLANANAASAQVSLEVLHEFGANGDGSYPVAPLLQATDGNFYGTTALGGPSNVGTIFKMTPFGTASVLHAFTVSIDGGWPTAPLIQATDGNFYGTNILNILGPALFGGTAFRMTPGGDVTVLHTFGGSADGSAPVAPLIQAADGNFYGTTYYSDSSGGTVFKMTPGGAENVLHVFTPGNSGDGDPPAAPLIQAADGNFYGTTKQGNTFNNGSIFRITPDGTFSVLHIFTGGSDGGTPEAALIQATDGNFYGTTHFGGLHPGSFGGGTVFKMTPGGTFSVLHSFTNGLDGGFSTAPLIQASDGNFYGTTSVGGEFDQGTVFRMTPSGVVTTLHAFGSSPTDGANPMAGLVEASDGILYGTTSAGGSFSGGTVFRVDTFLRCRDTLSLSYSAGTLHIGFTLRSPGPATWSTWAYSSFGVVNLWSVEIPVALPEVSFDVPIPGFPAIGPLGIVTTLSTKEGATCFDWNVVDTGGGASAQSVQPPRGLLVPMRPVR